MKEKVTIEEFFERFDDYKTYKSEHGVTSCIIYPGFHYEFIEVTEEFKNQLKKELQTKLTLIASGIEEPDAITKFCVMVLENSY